MESTAVHSQEVNILHLSSTVIQNLERATTLATNLSEIRAVSKRRKIHAESTNLIASLSNTADGITKALSNYSQDRSSFAAHGTDLAKDAITAIADDIGREIIKPLHFCITLINANAKKGIPTLDFPSLRSVSESIFTDMEKILKWLEQASSASPTEPLKPLPATVSERLKKYQTVDAVPQYLSVPVSSQGRKQLEKVTVLASLPVAPPNKLEKSFGYTEQHQKAARQAQTGLKIFSLFRRSSCIAPPAQKPKLASRTTLAGPKMVPLSNESVVKQTSAKRPASMPTAAPHSSPMIPQTSSTEMAAVSGEAAVDRPEERGMTSLPTVTVSSSSSSVNSYRTLRSEEGLNGASLASPATSMSSVSLSETAKDSGENSQKSPEVPSPLILPELDLKTETEKESGSPIQFNTELSKDIHFKDAKSDDDASEINEASSPKAQTPELKTHVLQAESSSPTARMFSMSRTPSDDEEIPLSVRMAERSRSMTPTASSKLMAWNVPSTPSVTPSMEGCETPTLTERTADRVSSMTPTPTRRNPPSNRSRLCAGALSVQSNGALKSGTIIAVPATKAFLSSVSGPAESLTLSRSHRNSSDSNISSLGKKKWFSVLSRRSSHIAASSPVKNIQNNEVKEECKEAAWKCNICPCTIPLGQKAPESALTGATTSADAYSTILSSLSNISKLSINIAEFDPVASRVLGQGGPVQVLWRFTFLLKSHAAYLGITSEMSESTEKGKANSLCCLFCAHSNALASSLGSQASTSTGHNSYGSSYTPSASSVSLPGPTIYESEDSSTTSNFNVNSAPTSAGPATANSSPKGKSVALPVPIQRLNRQSNPGFYKRQSLVNRSKPKIAVYHDPKTLFEHIVRVHAYDAQVDSRAKKILGAVAMQANCTVVVGQTATVQHGPWDLNIIW